MAARSKLKMHTRDADLPSSQGRPLGNARPGGSSSGSTPLYKGEPLDPERGPGLGCFWTQGVILAILVVLTPIGVMNAWPTWLTTAMLFATLVLLLLAGQTMIFLLRLVAADRRTRRRPLQSATPTVGQLEDATPPTSTTPPPTDAAARPDGQALRDPPQPDSRGVRQ